MPLTDELTVLDFAAQRRYPLIVVGSLRLGSINHTLLTLEAAQRRGVAVRGLVLNAHPGAPAEIAADSRRVFREALARHGYPPVLVELPEVPDATAPPAVDFSPLFPDVGR